MDIKKQITFEITKEERIYRFEIPDAAPLGEAYEACGACLDKLVQLINEHAEKMRPKNIEEENDDEKKQES